MNRLDTVLGPENWWDRYVPGENSVLCELTIRLPDGSMLTKADAGGYAGMADSGDDDKSGYSDAFKRAAVEVWCGPLPLPRRSPGVRARAALERRPGSGRCGEHCRAAVRISPCDNAGIVVELESTATSTQTRSATSSGHGNGGPPRSGKALFAWTKDQEQRYSVGLLKYLNSWAKLQEFPGRMVDWDAEQVTLAHAEACRKLQSLQSSTSEAYEEALSN